MLIRASELGGCTKAIIAKQLGYEPLKPREQTASIMREGNLHEDDVVAQLTEESPVTSQQEEVNLPIGEHVVQGHIDGRWDGRLLEIKSVSQSVWEEFERHRWAAGYFPKYKWQLSVYMLATGLEATVAIKNRNTGRIRREGVEIPFYSLDEITERVNHVADWVTRGLLPGPCDTPTFPCPYYYLHEDEKVLEKDEVLDGLASDYQTLREREVRLRDSIQAVRTQIRKAMGDRPSVETHRVRVTVYQAKGQTRYDAAQMELDGIDPQKYKVEGAPSERMRITLKEQDEPETSGNDAVP